MARRRRRPRMLLASLVVCLLAVAGMGAGVGFVLGAGSVNPQEFTPAQEEFMRGLVVGAGLRNDRTYLNDSGRRSACAGQFYPTSPSAMAGCVAGLHDPGPDGYHMPPG